MSKIYIQIGNQKFTASLYDSPTATAILTALPFESTVSTWGNEIYFQVPAEATLEEDALDVVDIGALAYWPKMPAFCIFFGATPASMGDEPRAASAVNVFGKLNELDVQSLRDVEDGEKVIVTWERD